MFIQRFHFHSVLILKSLQNNVAVFNIICTFSAYIYFIISDSTDILHQVMCIIVQYCAFSAPYLAFIYLFNYYKIIHKVHNKKEKVKNSYTARQLCFNKRTVTVIDCFVSDVYLMCTLPIT